MLSSYAASVLLLFAIHTSLRHKYDNSLLRCAVWAVIWPVDVAIVLRGWVRSGPKDGGDINNAQLISRLKSST